MDLLHQLISTSSPVGSEINNAQEKVRIANIHLRHEMVRYVVEYSK